MIYTITLNPYIEKRIHGKNLDPLVYEMDSVTYHAGGTGLRTSLFLKEEQIDSEACYVCGNNIAKYIKNDLMNVSSFCMEVAKEGQIKTSMYEEDTCLAKEKVEDSMDDMTLYLFDSIVCEKIKEEDVVVLEYNDTTISKETMSSFYNHIRSKTNVLLTSIHPSYYEGIKDSSNVLLLDERTYVNYRNFDKVPPLSTIVAYINEHYTPYAKIFIYAINNHHFILFFDGAIYEAYVDIEEEHTYVYKEAFFSGLIKCFLEDGDVSTLVKECLAMSVGTSLSDGMIKPLKETQYLIKNKIELHKI